MEYAMKKLIFVLIGITIMMASTTTGQSLEKFNNYFLDETMRIDYFHIGDDKTEYFTLDQVYRYGTWAGSRVNLIDEFNNGRYYAHILDSESNELIYTKGYDSFFGEYQTSSPAIEGIKRTYHESLIIPFPKNKIKLSILRRDKDNNLNEFYSTEIEPLDVKVIKLNLIDKTVKITKSLSSGDPHQKVDVAILGEGYTIDEENKFKNDLKRFTEIFFDQEPYKSNKDKFNIYGVFKPSLDSGISEPRAGNFKNTTLSTTFNSMGSERYILTEDNKTMRDLAAYVPYDAIYIMINHSRYGGGGIYNLFCTFTVENQWFKYLFLHEFGHSFAGLADEYYTSAVQYNDFYKKGVEPVEPNITALLNPAELKWKHFVKDGTEIPTPWEKEDFDNMDTKWQKKRKSLNNNIAELKKNAASTLAIVEAEEEYTKKDKDQAVTKDKYLAKSKFTEMVGAFEGAGYSAKGMYRPMLDCIMFSQGNKPFCKVCEERIKKVINHYTE
jgi:IgA peptidase M64/peptidase M64-like protein